MLCSCSGSRTGWTRSSIYQMCVSWYFRTLKGYIFVCWCYLQWVIALFLFSSLADPSHTILTAIPSPPPMQPLKVYTRCSKVPPGPLSLLPHLLLRCEIWSSLQILFPLLFAKVLIHFSSHCSLCLLWSLISISSCICLSVFVPNTVQEALSTSEWWIAMEDELSALHHNGT